MTAFIIPLIYMLPDTFTFTGIGTYDVITCTPWRAFSCVAAGLWSGLIIGWITEVYTSNAYSPV